MPRRTCHDDYPTLAKTGHPVYPGLPNRLDPATLERAKALLLAGRPAHDVAVTIGYVNSSSFGRAFTALVGVSPGAWQREAGVQRLQVRGGLGARRKRKVRDRTDEIPLPRTQRRRDRTGSSGT
jgi:hypothetical protein